MQKMKQNVCEGAKQRAAKQVRDVNSRNLFKDPVLCSQFLRDYVDEQLFKDVLPEDIEDESEKYQAYLGIAFETDTVKKVRIRKGQDEVPLYLVSLIEHKSQVDYNITMQLLRYMVCIWNEYGKEMMARQQGNVKNKSFRYPPILPIVYYEGMDKWTADMHFKNRILLNGLFEEYIPDLTYKLVRNQDYSNEELLEKEDEMSLLMLLGKAQTAEELNKILHVEKDKVDKIIRNAPESILEQIAGVVWSLCMKMNVPQEEAEACVQKVRERQMGFWFENMEKMDIQEERRNTAKARQEVKEIRQELEEAHENAIKSLVAVCQELGAPKEVIVAKLMEQYQLDQQTAEEKAALYWTQKE